MTPLDMLGLLGLLAGAAAVLATLFVKGKDKAVSANWQQVATSATARAEEAARVSEVWRIENAALAVRIEALEEQVRVLVDTITAKQSINELSQHIDLRFADLTALVTEAITTSGVPRAPSSARRPS